MSPTAPALPLTYVDALRSRMECNTIRELLDLLKEMNGRQNALGFDPWRDPRTSTKSALINYLLTTYNPGAVQGAMQRLKLISPFDAGELNALMNRSNQSSGAAESTPPTEAHPAPEVDAQLATDMAFLLQKHVKAQASRLPAITEQTVRSWIAASLTEISAATTQELQEIAAKFDARLTERLEEIEIPTRVVLQIPNQAPIATGIVHKNFPLLLQACNARLADGHRLNIWLKGPAGSGKTTAAKTCAETLGLKFWFNGAISTEYALMGFVDASGRYHRTAFREAYEHGGVYLFDEVDSSNPNAVLAFNAALSNGVCYFPDGVMIQRHADCVILAGANTSGQGATAEYAGRFKQDAAFLDRFVLLEWPIDEAMEKAIAGNDEWFKTVKKTRANASKRALKNFTITPRASLYGAALIAAGINDDAVQAMTLRKGLSEDSWKEICV